MKKLKLKFKVFVTSLIILTNLVYVPALAVAENAPVPPIPPTAPTAPTPPVAPTPPAAAPAPTAPTAPTPPTAPVPPAAPTAPVAPTNAPSNSPVVDVTSNPNPSAASVKLPTSSSTNSGNGSGSTNSSSTSTNNNTGIVNVNDAAVTNNLNVASATGGNSASKNMGDSTVKSGNSSVKSGLINDLNNNTVTIGDLCGLGCSEDFVAANLKNGNGTLNNADGSLTKLVLLNNSNNLKLANNSYLSASTGYNQASKNMGGGTIVSGNADVAFTTINLGNNNGINASTANYNIVDNQSADLWIQFPTGVASGSGLGSLGATNSGNGASSNNTATTSSSSTTTIDNNNNLVLNNDINLYANTGNNTADKNMGSGNITTGNANIASNVINFLNNNIVAGAQWLLSTVNIFGNMTGNIILPRQADLSGCGCAADITAGNIGNGVGSTNSAASSTNKSTTINNANNAIVANNLSVNSNTGGNSTDKNMGNSSITTGSTSVNSNLVTVANTNAVGQGDTWWLVIVNNHGNYTGQIVGAGGATIAGSGLQFGVSPSGTVYALNSGNGAASTNNANTSSNSSTTINNTNTATINNNIKINANTGNNTADKNMGGGNIKTGNVNVVSNIVNFINNNFVGKKFVVTLVNIFGSFSGKIVPPDQALPQTQAAAGLGGPTSINLPSSATVTGSEVKVTKPTSVLAPTPSNNAPQTLSQVLKDSGKILEDAASTQGKVNDSVKKVVGGSGEKSSFQFNFVLLGIALLVLAAYGFVSRRKAS